MINICVISVGAVKEKYLQEMISDYSKRISKYANLEVITLKDETLALAIPDGFCE